MSRCFPFPPPGYEKKPTTDDIDLLKKEKRKEKKHKKDKKDKEKRDGKEKREKDRSDGKHNEKKDKKDKHRDKKKDKENGKDKEKGKSNASDEKRVDGQSEGYNGEKLLQNDEHSKQKSDCSGTKKPPFPFQNKKEISNKESCSSSDDKRSSVQFRGQNGEFPFRNRITAEENENSKFVQELGRRIRDEEMGTSSHQVVVENRKENVNRIEIRKTDGNEKMVQNMTGGNEKTREKESDDKRGDKRKNKDRAKEKTEEKKPKEKSELKKAERDKHKHVKNSDTVASLSNLAACSPNNSIQRAGSESKKRKDTETNGFSHENEPRPNKMAWPTENERKLDFLQNPGLTLSDKQGPSPASFKVDGKERKVNGITASRPTSLIAKKPPIPASNHIPCKPTSTKSPPFITNRTSTQPLAVSSTKPSSTVPNHITTQSLPVSSTKPLSTVPNHVTTQSLPVPSTKPSSTVANQNLAHSLPVSPPKPSPFAAQPLPNSKKKPFPSTPEASKKPPHPDTKYLNQILTIPKLEPWSDLDEQDWLFSGKDKPHFKKTTMVDSLQDNKELQVWSEAKHLESVDVCALPYVIPY